MKAAYKHEVDYAGYIAVDLQPGQFLYSRRMAQRETGLSERTVTSCLKVLSDGDNASLSHETHRTYTVVTVLKMPSYQGWDSKSAPAMHQERTSTAPACNKEEEVKETLAGASEKTLSLGRDVIGLTCDRLLDDWVNAWPDAWVYEALSKCRLKEMRGTEASLYAQGILRSWAKKGGPEKQNAQPVTQPSARNPLRPVGPSLREQMMQMGIPVDVN